MEKQILKTTLISDSQIAVFVTLVKKTDKMAFVETDNGEIVRCKIKTSFDGRKYIMPFGNYSMAPIFDIN